MKIHTMLAPLLAFVLVSTAAFAAAAPAYAACSPNGLINSGGTCAVSYQNNQAFRYQFQERYYENRETVILAMIERLQAMIELLEERLDNIPEPDDLDSDINVTTRAAVDIEEDSAALRGRLYIGTSDEAEVWFQYGETRYDLDEATDKETFDDNDARYLFSSDVTDLDENSRYYFRAVGEDDNGDVDYGAIYTFRTDDADDELPDVDTDQAEDITEDAAELHGSVDMNDFDDGRVFFVYGEDESLVEDIAEDHDSYSAIDEEGDDLQKVTADTNLDGSSNYQLDIDDLDSDTDIYFSLCVEFEDEDDDDMLVCGDVEAFTTDEN